MASQAHCRKCGAPLTQDAREGVCPRCLLEQALGDGSEEQGAETQPQPHIITEEAGVVIGRDLADWWEQPNETNTTFNVAWTGSNAKSRRSGSRIRLFKSTWINPRPGQLVRSLDFQAAHDSAALFVVAITAEP